MLESSHSDSILFSIIKIISGLRIVVGIGIGTRLISPTETLVVGIGFFISVHLVYGMDVGHLNLV